MVLAIKRKSKNPSSSSGPYFRLELELKFFKPNQITLTPKVVQ